jgi:hypothetical protein
MTFRTMKKWPYKTGDLFKEVQVIWIFHDRKKTRWPFNTGDCLIEVTTWAGLTICLSCFPCFYIYIEIQLLIMVLCSLYFILYKYHIQLTLVISNSMGPWKKFESTVVWLKRSYEDSGSVVCLTTKGRQLKRNFEELKPASHVPILGTILNIFEVFVAVFFSPLNSLNLVKRLITSRYLFLCEW